MKIKNYIFMIVISILLICSISYVFKKAGEVPEKNMKNIGTQTNTSRIKESINNAKSGFPGKSGPVTDLPWENNFKFKEAQKTNDTNILLAAYVTVLEDPLPGEEYNVHLAADSLAGIVVPSGHVFSQNNSIGPYIESRGYKKGPTYVGSRVTTTAGGGVCKIASTLYNVSVLSNVEIIERHNHGMPVPYVPYGQDATVAYGAKDFKFKNNNDSPILIWAKGIENRLYIAFYGKKKPPKIEWQHNILATEEAPKEYKINPDLEENEEKVIIKGMDGVKIDSYI
ncbi:MAG TPA: VanW family protein, partial [Oscillospiraceae bacterium]|nr:VanW family protein [Oscillospiraceae bacterium]